MFLIIFFSLLFSTDSHGSEKPLWREWYTFTRGGQPSGYYVENFYRKAGVIVVEQVIVERSASGLVETFVHSEANDNETAFPASFYVKKRQLGNVDIFEGIVSGKEIGFRVHLGQENIIPVTSLEPLPKDVVLGAFVPYYLSKISRRKPNAKANFESLLEEGEGKKFNFAKISAEPTNSKRQIKKETCFEYKLRFNDVPASWWISSQGKLCQMLIPSLGSELQLATESEARKFL